MGNTSSRPEEEERVSHDQSTSAIASGASVCEVCSVLPHSAECGNEIRVQSGVWQKWKDFHDHFEYYLFRVKLFHYAICIRRCDTGATLTIDLVVRKAKSKADSKWYIRVRETEWKPGNRNVSMSKHKWHAATALKAVHTFSPKFGDWTAIANNCNTWVKGVVGFMSDDKRRGQCDCDPITDDFDHLRSFGESIGVELTYLSSAEAKRCLPQSEDDDEIVMEGGGPSNQEANKESIPGETRNMVGAEGESQEMNVIHECGEEVTNTTEVQGKEGREERRDSEIEDLNNKE